MNRLRAAVIGPIYPELAAALAAAEVDLVEDRLSAEAVIVTFGGASAELTELVTQSSSLRWVQLPSAGIEAFNDALKARPDLQWTSAKGAYGEPVAEHALALTLALLRELPTRVVARAWAPASGTSLHGLRVTVVGSGGVALEIVRLMKCFRTDVTVVRRTEAAALGADRTVGTNKLREVLPTTDVLVLAAALTPSTRNMISTAELELLGEQAIIVNIARGGLIDTDALTSHLAAKRIAGAALDVTEPEPLPEGHPLWDEARALITPHAADTLEMIQPLFAARVADNLTRYHAGSPLSGQVDAEAGY